MLNGMGKKTKQKKIKEIFSGLKKNDSARGVRKLNNGFFGIFIKKMHLTHVKNQVHILIDLRAVMGSYPGNKSMLSGVQIQINL